MSKENDVVVFLDNYFAQYVTSASAPTLLNLHNVEGWSAAESPPATPLRRILHNLGVRQIRAVEGRAVRKATIVSVTSEAESKRLRALYNVPSIVIPSCVAIPTSISHRRGKATVVWLGSHSYAPNVDGLRRFLDICWPQIYAATSAELRIAGGGPKPEIVRRDGTYGIRVLGFVDRLDDLLSEATVGVVPLWQGVGVKLKTVTMMAHMVPVVTTTVGAEEIPRDGEPLLVVDDPNDLASAVVRVLGDAALAHRLAVKGQEVVRSRFSLEALERMVAVVLESLTDGLEDPSKTK